MILFANCNVGIIRVYRTTELEENLSRFAEISPFFDGTTGFSTLAGRGFSQKLYTFTEFLEFLTDFSEFFTCCLLKKGLVKYCFVWLASSIKNFGKRNIG